MPDYVLPLCAICLGAGAIAGGWLAWWATRRYYREYSPRKNIYSLQTTQTDRLILQYIGTLDEAHFKLLCAWITDGKPFRLQALTNAHVLTRTQFERVRQELLDRRLAYQNSNKTVVITPPGYAFFRWGAGRHKQSNSKQGDKQ